MVSNNSVPTLAFSLGLLIHLINLNCMLSWQRKHCYRFLLFITCTPLHMYLKTGNSLLQSGVKHTVCKRTSNQPSSVCQLFHTARLLSIHKTKRIFYISMPLFYLIYRNNQGNQCTFRCLNSANCACKSFYVEK